MTGGVATKAPAYPPTERQALSERHFGVEVADPYRWLEDDVRVNPKVAEWVAAQNEVSETYLMSLPGRDLFKARMKALFGFERIGVPEKKGGRYFYSRNTGLQNQDVLFVRDSLDGVARQLIDPNLWSSDGATALAEWKASEDGKHLLYSVQEGGSDWRVVRLLDVDSGRTLPDEVSWVKYSRLDWAKDCSGFFYSRFPEPKAGAEFQSTTEGQQVWFHRLGTTQSDDRLVFERSERPELGNTAQVSDDGRWLIVNSSEGTDSRYEITLVDLSQPGSAPRPFVTGLDHDWRFLGNRGTTFFWVTNRGAPRLRIVATDIDRPVSEARQLVPEDQATLDSAAIVGERILVSYLVDARSEIRSFALDGRRLGGVELPGIGTAGGFSGDADEAEGFFAFTSFNYPTTIYLYDAASGAARPWAQPDVAFAPEDFTVEQRFYRSKDGTSIPLFLVYRAGLDIARPRPTLLYGYGGFDVAITPAFSATNLAWIEQGGVYVVANIRGGSEYGRVWHDAGRLANKQNVFDDFIAAAEYLIAEKVTTSRQLAIYGRSNGGLLVGAVVGQRPDLFAAALPAVGVMDMLRFDRFTAGRYWVDDYGRPEVEADFRTLHAYSPYHNIRPGTAYPPLLVTTADTDDRVVPGHSFKYAAAMQAADPDGAPHLIRIETRAGHGSGKPTDKIIEEYADMWAFIAHHTGLEVSADPADRFSRATGPVP